MVEQERPLSPSAQGLVELARDAGGPMTEARRVAGLRALRVRLSRRHRDRNVLRGALGLSMAVALVACFVFGVSWAKHRSDVGASKLALHVDGAVLQADGAVESTGSLRPVLRFSDGSEISLGAGTRARVRSTDEHGARVTLEEGEARVYVVHAPGTRWTLDAGPFVVAVTGTAFTLSWHEEQQRFDLRLENGTVNVSGPASDAPMALRAGQWLTIRYSEQGGDVRIRSLDASEDVEGGVANATGAEPLAPVSGESPAPSRGGADSAARADGARRNGSRGPREHHWAADLARGRSDAVVTEAVALGLDGVFAESQGDELAALADAARYTHRPDIARAAYLAQRRRFPSSEIARAAAFGLGRMADADEDPRAAMSWFDTYLAEAPDGRYASEALGRKMMLVKLLDGQEGARTWAELYLRRFPGGTYAAAARAMTGAR